MNKIDDTVLQQVGSFFPPHFTHTTLARVNKRFRLVFSDEQFLDVLWMRNAIGSSMPYTAAERDLLINAHELRDRQVRPLKAKANIATGKFTLTRMGHRCCSATFLRDRLMTIATRSLYDYNLGGRENSDPYVLSYPKLIASDGLDNVVIFTRRDVLDVQGGIWKRNPSRGIMERLDSCKPPIHLALSARNVALVYSSEISVLSLSRVNRGNFSISKPNCNQLCAELTPSHCYAGTDEADASISQWDLARNRQVRQFGRAACQGLAIQESTVMSRSSQIVQLWDVRTKAARVASTPDTCSIVTKQFSAFLGSHIVCGGEQRNSKFTGFHFYDIRKGLEKPSIGFHMGVKVNVFAAHPLGYLFLGTDNDSLIVDVAQPPKLRLGEVTAATTAGSTLPAENDSWEF